MRLIVFCFSLCLLMNTAFAQTPSVPPLSDVKYFQSSPPPPGLYARHKAGVGGVLNIKDGCLRIGKSIPTLDHDLIFSEDEQGLYLKHIYGENKYRIGDTVKGGGGYLKAMPGQSREGCVPEAENGHAYFISFHLEVQAPKGLRWDCPYGRYDRGDGLCIPYPGVNSCPEGTKALEDGTCVVLSTPNATRDYRPGK